MTANEGDRNHDGEVGAMTRRDLAFGYVDGTLDDKLALRVHLQARTDALLAQEIERARAFFGALDAMPPAEPSADFDARILAAVPLERYRSAPRRAPAVLVIGDLAPAAWMRALVRAGRGAMAAAAAYVLMLVVGNTALQGLVVRMSAATRETLEGWARASESTPVLSALVGGVARGYSALVGATQATADAIGPEVTVVVVGTVVGVLALAALTARQRRFAPTVHR